MQGGCASEPIIVRRGISSAFSDPEKSFFERPWPCTLCTLALGPCQLQRQSATVCLRVSRLEEWSAPGQARSRWLKGLESFVLSPHIWSDSRAAAKKKQTKKKLRFVKPSAVKVKLKKDFFFSVFYFFNDRWALKRLTELKTESVLPGCFPPWLDEPSLLIGMIRDPLITAPSRAIRRPSAAFNNRPLKE